MEKENQVPRQNSCLLAQYWGRSVRIMVLLLVVWSLVGLVASILLADWLNEFRLPGTGFPLGFWFAHQGSIVGFVLLILVYCLLMNRLDRKHHAEIEKARHRSPE